MAETPLSAAVWDALHRLAYLDGERTVALHQLADARAHADRDAQLEQARATMDEATAAAREAFLLRRKHETAIADLNAQITRTDARLASGKLSSEREVAAAMSELEQLRALLVQTEGEWLETTAVEETRNAALPPAKEALARVEREAAARQEAARQEARAGEARVAEIDAARRAAVAVIPGEIRDRYRALFPRTGGRPFAAMVAGECSNCHHPLPGAAVQQVRVHAGVPQCPSCGRLVLD